MAADVVGGAAGGAAAGAPAGPYGAAIGAGIGALGSIVGGAMGDSALRSAWRRYQENAQKGITNLNAGINNAQAIYDPYYQATGSTITGLSNAINSRQSAPQPEMSNYNVDAYMNPSAAYTTQQANNAMQSSSLAHGGLGGGLGKALSNNANKMAMTNYNNAYQQMIDTNAQRFGQGQQRYANATDYAQSQIGNRQNLASLALQGASAGQGIQQGYRNNIANMWSGAATTGNEFGQNQAGLYSSLASNVGKGLGQAAQTYMAGYKG